MPRMYGLKGKITVGGKTMDTRGKKAPPKPKPTTTTTSVPRKPTQHKPVPQLPKPTPMPKVPGIKPRMPPVRPKPPPKKKPTFQKMGKGAKQKVKSHAQRLKEAEKY